MNKRHIALILILFVVIQSFIFIITRYYPRLDKTALMVGNAILAALTFFAFYRVSKTVNSRPQAFVQGVYAATFLKLMVCMAGLLTYALANRATLYKPTLFALFGIYIIYTIGETAVLSKTARKN